MTIITKLFYIFKAIVLFIGMMVISLLVVIFGLPWWGKPILNSAFTFMFSKFVCFVVGVKIERINYHKLQIDYPAVLIGNHQTALDFALISTVTPKNMVIVGKKEIVYLPFIGWYFKIAGNLFINRSDSKSSITQMNELAKVAVKKNLSISIFPEGTRNKKSNEELLPFKKGAFQIAFAQGLPIIPVVCSSLKNIAVWEKFELGGGKVKVKVLEQIETKNIPQDQITATIEKIHAHMQAELDLLNAELRKENGILHV